MVQGYTAQDNGSGCVRPSFPDRNRQAQRGRIFVLLVLRNYDTNKNIYSLYFYLSKILIFAFQKPIKAKAYEISYRHPEF